MPAMTAAAEKRLATDEDVLAAPEHMIAQVVNGELILQPRPSVSHSLAASGLGEELGPPFKRGKGGPGGWLILGEPELHLNQHILVPDLAGWRRERMPEAPDAAYFTLAPDWVCEVLSPSTQGIDRVRKMRIYAQEKVSYVWMVDPGQKTLEVFRLVDSMYQLILAAEGEERVKAEPFDAIELDLAILWQR